jgi:single-strand DNA-binding protein
MFNKATSVGRLGTEPEIRYTQDQKPVCSFRVATSESWKNKQGERQEKVEWHRVVLFGPLAEIAKNHLHKGSLALFEGPIRTRKYQSEGRDVYTTEIHVIDMKMLPSKSDNTGSASATSDSDYADWDGNFD